MTLVARSRCNSLTCYGLPTVACVYAEWYMRCVVSNNLIYRNVFEAEVILLIEALSLSPTIMKFVLRICILLIEINIVCHEPKENESLYSLSFRGQGRVRQYRLHIRRKHQRNR